MSLDELLTIAAVDNHRPCTQAAGQHRRPGERTSWLCLVDRVLGDWPRTLRATLLCGLLLLALVVMLAILVGIRPALLVAGLYGLHRLILHRQVHRLRLV